MQFVAWHIHGVGQRAVVEMRKYPLQFRRQRRLDAFRASGSEQRFEALVAEALDHGSACSPSSDG
jgi:hypothetical protein